MTTQSFTFNVLDVDRFTTREVYGKVLAQLAETNRDIVVLTADLKHSNKSGDFAAAHPDRFFNFGIAEQNMMAAAAGFALCGKIAFVCTFAFLATLRCCEQVRTDIAYPNLKVRILGSHAGLSMGVSGATHHAIEDIAIVRSMPNMTVIVPADPVETSRAVEASIEYPGPIYMRLGRGAEPIVYKQPYDYRIGEAVTLRDGGDVTVIACGPCVMAAIRASRELEKEGISLRILDMHTIKPIDREAILRATETGGIVTVEEHSVIGGLGSAVADVLAESGMGVRFKKVGIPDVYTGVGPPDDLCSRYGIDAQGIATAVKEILSG